MPHATLYKFGACGFQRSLHLIECAWRHLTQPIRRFQPPDCDHRDVGTTRQFFLVHPQKRTRGTNLLRRDQHERYISTDWYCIKTTANHQISSGAPAALAGAHPQTAQIRHSPIGMTGIQLPYFDYLLSELNRRNPTIEKSFGRHVHWGYWADPRAAKDTDEDSTLR